MLNIDKYKDEILKRYENYSESIEPHKALMMALDEVWVNEGLNEMQLFFQNLHGNDERKLQIKWLFEEEKQNYITEEEKGVIYSTEKQLKRKAEGFVRDKHEHIRLLFAKDWCDVEKKFVYSNGGFQNMQPNRVYSRKDLGLI